MATTDVVNAALSSWLRVFIPITANLHAASATTALAIGTLLGAREAAIRSMEAIVAQQCGWGPLGLQQSDRSCWRLGRTSAPAMLAANRPERTKVDNLWSEVVTCPRSIR
jgi:hypothetical protein